MATTNGVDAVNQDDLVIPLIDFQPFLEGTPSDKHSVAVSITEAFKTSGFIYLRNHGIPPSVARKVFDTSAGFFARPQEQKDRLVWTSPESNRGYSTLEKLALPEQGGVAQLREDNPDLKETYNVGRDDVEGLPNHWPDSLDDEGKRFKVIMKDFFETCKTVHVQVMRAIALGMSLPEHFFDEFLDQGDNTLRLLHYPSVSKSLFQRKEGQVRAGEHSDYGSLTLLFQDSKGGLQVRSPKGTFIDATPIADTIVVNAGDLLARWSNDEIKSTKHRVVEPPAKPGVDDDSDEYPARYSIAYFCNPNLDKFIEALPGTYGEEKGERKYSGISSGQYLVQRLTATY